MSDKFSPLPLRQLLKLILKELDHKRTLFGIPEELFFRPCRNTTMATDILGHHIKSPLGVAAGPHTQLSQNIVAAWITGARYIELKTVQTLDDLDVSKPCIDMQDEGYNCEWSQELKIKESFNEYLNAWIIIHILNHWFGWGDDPGIIFNMSVGYNLEGIMQDNVQWFLDRMTDCSEELNSKLEEIIDICPDAVDIDIPSRLSDNITISTMHGCPPGEIESIARYFITERRLHTLVKLNPTLLGPSALREILNTKLNFRTIVPNEAFTHDLKYTDAITLIMSLQSAAAENRLQFGLKLTNTLESMNNRDVFCEEVDMMYMSGRALHPVSVTLARKLQEEFGGKLFISFSAGADAFNVASLLSCGFRTVTVCSDLLKPGGYMRLNQYFKEIQSAFDLYKAENVDDFILKSGGRKERNSSALLNLKKYSEVVVTSPAYKREYLRAPDIKSGRELDLFDCIAAPCRQSCATAQDIPDYLWYTSLGRFDKAFEVILRTNPFPTVTGMICDHLCQGSCTRINYDDALQIRDVKRFISFSDEVPLRPSPENGIRAAVTGAGPAGLSCAFYLRMAGFTVDVFESRSQAGGMIRYAIPGFRLTDDAVDKDIDRITRLGVNIHFNSRVDSEMFAALKRDYRFVFVSPGAQAAALLRIEGADKTGVTDPLQFLFRARGGKETGIGKNIVIIGGGNTAMDAARTAWRIAGSDGTVTIVYRRTVNEMPADQGEIKEVLKEGIKIIELSAPERIIEKDGKVAGIVCSRMELRGKDAGGRPVPVKIEGTEFEIPCDTVIPAIGQAIDIDFAVRDELTTDDNSFLTKIKGVYTGGDAMRGASTAIKAIGDGRKAAEEIISAAGFDLKKDKTDPGRNLSYSELMIKRAVRIHAEYPPEPADEERRSFSLLSKTQDRDTMVKEADRCLWCDEICSICTTVCPNLANRTFRVTPFSIMLQKAVREEDDTIRIEDDTVFEIRQQYQIIHIADFCNECGNCNTFCPTAGAPYLDKPKFHLSTASFNEAEEGYLLSSPSGRKTLIHKHKGNFATLTEMPEKYIFETDFVTATLSKGSFRLAEVRFLTPCVKEAHFQRAMTMAVLLEGAESLLQA